MGLVVAVLTLCLGPAAARADAAADADAAFREGSQLYRQHDYVAAAHAFERADVLMPHGVARYSAGLAWQGAREPARAADSYAEALDSGQLSDEQAADARARLAELAPALGQLSVSGPAGTRISIAHVSGAVPPIRVHLAPGQHQLSGMLPDGSPVRESVTIVAGEQARVALEAPATGAPPPPEPAQPEDRAEGGSAQPIIGWIALGTGAAAATVAIVLGSMALSARDDFYDSDFRDPDARERADSLRTATNVTWVAAGVLATTGAVLLLTSLLAEDDDPPRQEGVALRLGPGAIELSGTF